MYAPFFIVMLVTTLVLFLIAMLTAERITRHHYEQRSDLYARYPVTSSDIVFLGDSITDGAVWDEMFPGLPVKQRGINADTTAGVLRRLDPILNGKPTAIFLLIGTNDLPWTFVHNAASILKTYNKILDQCKEKSPETRVFVQSILPRSPRYGPAIQMMNRKLAGLAGSHGYIFIDLFSYFADRKNGLRDELTNDHLHLMAKGYELWLEILRPYIDGLKITPAEKGSIAKQ
jgi:lysophospholipase L1-like esterase